MKTEQPSKRLRYKIPDISGCKWLLLSVLAASGDLVDDSSDLESIVDSGGDIPWI